MKNFLLLILLLLSINVFAQDWDEDRHHKNKKHHKKNEYRSNYFTIGLYTGTYIGHGPAYERNYFINSVATEIEYFKFKDFSIYIKGLYQFTKTSFYNLYGYHQASNVTFNEPYTNRIVFSFGGRYYLGKKHNKVNPYLQLGINQDGSFINNYSSITTYPDGTTYISYYNKFYKLRFGLNLGIGFNVKLSKRFSFDMKYDLMKSLTKETRNNNFNSNNQNNSNSGINAFSVFAGIKYNL